MFTVGEILILLVCDFATDGLACRNNSVFFIHFWHRFSPLEEFFMATISYCAFATLSGLLPTPGFPCLPDGQDQFLADSLVSPARGEDVRENQSFFVLYRHGMF
jgi:hypothetical protein